MDKSIITLVGGKSIGGERPCFIIAEAGQNHQGDINIAKELILNARVSRRTSQIKICTLNLYNIGPISGVVPY